MHGNVDLLDAGLNPRNKVECTQDDVAVNRKHPDEASLLQVPFQPYHISSNRALPSFHVMLASWSRPMRAIP